MESIEYHVMLENSVEVAVECRCGDTHYCRRPLTADEKRKRNRQMVAWQANVDAYAHYGADADAWKYRTLNLDGAMEAGLL
jgi:hypothetical protein